MDPLTLADGHQIAVGRLPEHLLPGDVAFEALWQLHPTEAHLVRMLGRSVPTPRWQQAYGEDYRYTGATNVAQPITAELIPFLSWSQRELDPRLNGVLVNWYDGALGHYIGAHRDSDLGRVLGSDIVTVSLGEARTFRIRTWRGRERWDIPVSHGTVVVIPWQTNRAFTHEVPPSKRALGRRISITLRAFTQR